MCAFASVGFWSINSASIKFKSKMIVTFLFILAFLSSKSDSDKDTFQEAIASKS